MNAAYVASNVPNMTIFRCFALPGSDKPRCN